jgi:hypothetical protein
MALYVNGMIMAPLDEFISYFKYTSESSGNGYIIRNKDGNELNFTIGSTAAILDGTEIPLEFYPFYRDGAIYISLRCIAEALGLYTDILYAEHTQGYHIWVSESALLHSEEFTPDENYEFVELREGYDEMGYYLAADIYRLKEDGRTYSGVRIGDSYNEAVALLGSPQYTLYRDSCITLVMYEKYPGPGEYAISTLRISFEDGYVQEVTLILHVYPEWYNTW